MTSASGLTMASPRAGGTRVAMTGVGTAVPPMTMTQRESLDYILANFKIREGTKALYRRVMGHPGVLTRHFGMETPADSLETDLDRIGERFKTWAVRLGTEALRNALAVAGVAPAELGGLVTVTCTGYLCPGLSSYLAEEGGLAPDLLATDLVGMGCGAALPGLRLASDQARSRPDRPVAVVCVEICSAAIYDGDAADLVISNAIFGDGAASVVLRADGDGETGAARVRFPRLVDFETVTRPEWRKSLRFRTEGGRLRNMLSREVPAQAAALVPELVDRLLARNGLERPDISRWLLHPGGAVILDALRDALRLPEAALASGRGVLRDFGNLSSPSVVFVLDRDLADRPPAAGERALLISFGAGFSAHAALCQF